MILYFTKSAGGFLGSFEESTVHSTLNLTISHFPVPSTFTIYDTGTVRTKVSIHTVAVFFL